MLELDDMLLINAPSLHGNGLFAAAENVGLTDGACVVPFSQGWAVESCRVECLWCVCKALGASRTAGFCSWQGCLCVKAFSLWVFVDFSTNLLIT